ncbi:MAG TPA: NYN domain-containing protein [Dehalococcoidia bacterium]|nr:NYN domain-containing protein [Dehalococcoidia bacterium]
MARVIVDAMNVIGSRPDGWWRDRDGAALRLVGRLQRLVVATGDEVAALLDGRPSASLPGGLHDGVAVFYADRSGRDAADDRIVRLVQEDEDPGSLLVITSDRELRQRVELLGASCEGARSLLEQLDALDG